MFIYFIVAYWKTGDMWVKIGVSGSPLNRLKDIQPYCPLPLKLQYAEYSPNATGLEVKLHQEFASKRVRNEWFCLNDDDLRQAMEILDKERQLKLL